VIWTLPDRHSYVTIPGSALQFPNLCAPTGDPPPPAPGAERCGDKTALMPLRTETRAQNRAHRIATERRNNHAAPMPRRAESLTYAGPAPSHDDPPPF
jgi:hypothetical protein